MPASPAEGMQPDRGDNSARVKQARLLVLDADGVLTDGSLLYGPGGEVLQRFNVYDGYAIKCLQSAGVEVAILTGRCSDAVASRARALSIAQIVQGADDKGSALRHLAQTCGVSLAEVCYMGDDVFDLPAIRLAAWSAAPSNARPEVAAEVDYVCRASGGNGAVREIGEIILRSKNVWPPEGTMPSAVGS
jgi:3-deoxy-D-manno-octulosonate 8-phosphate phosphatase (KDO 8-P phosphatase)